MIPNVRKQNKYIFTLYNGLETKKVSVIAPSVIAANEKVRQSFPDYILVEVTLLGRVQPLLQIERGVYNG